MRVRFPTALGLLVILANSALGQEVQLAKPENHGMSSQRMSRAFVNIHEAINSNHIGGAVGLIARDGNIVFLESAGELGDRTPMPTNAITRLASITKNITAVAVMILYERGQLRLAYQSITKSQN